MKIISIEPTPSPNTMKILLDQELPFGKSHNYKRDSTYGAPEEVKKILAIEGVKGVYHVADFLAVERNAKFDWQTILSEIRKQFGQDETESEIDKANLNDRFGEVYVSVQMYKGIPMQVKISDGEQERRFALPDQFSKSVIDVQSPNDNVVMIRKWKELGVRYGELDEVGLEVTEELVAAYPPKRLEALVKMAIYPESSAERIMKRHRQISLSDFDHPDWRIRYQLLEEMESPTVKDIDLLEKALLDEKASIRRLATVYLGMIEDKKVLPLLYKALEDASVTVRRTAGDCLSDLGYKEAVEPMMLALQDKSKLVRWRAAMFLFETGDHKALPALKEAENDPEFEVRLQVRMAISRIEQGDEAKGSVWKQMTESRKK